MFLRLLNLLRSSHQIFSSALISGGRSLSQNSASQCILGKQSTYQKYLFFTRGMSEIYQGNESVADVNGNLVQMRGLPYEATTSDIINFFRPLNVEPVEVIIEKNRSGRPNGFAVVKFKSHNDAAKALLNHKNYIGRRYVELSMSNKLPVQHPAQLSPTSTLNFREGHKVILKGVPYEATTADIIQFFASLHIKPSIIEARYNHNNNPSGIWDCMFESREDAITSLQNHKAYIGNRWIEVVLQLNHKPFRHPADIAINKGTTSVKASAE